MRPGPDSHLRLARPSRHLELVADADDAATATQSEEDVLVLYLSDPSGLPAALDVLVPESGRAPLSAPATGRARASVVDVARGSGRSQAPVRLHGTRRADTPQG